MGQATSDAKVVTRLELDDTGDVRAIFGPLNSHLHALEKISKVKISIRGTVLVFQGNEEQVDLVKGVIEELYALAREGRAFYTSDVECAFQIKSQNANIPLRDILMDAVYISNRKRVITPKGLGQKHYIDAMRKYDVVIAIGPAGTGKTYLAMTMAISTLKKQKVRRIIITRPAVEAGEKLGFLPGNIAEKVNPYLRPIYDALHDIMDYDQANRLMERDVIEVAPLAFMRGRTLNDSFIILDEAQNTTSDQMKMFLTRLGFDSRVVITGDITQVDLPLYQPSGLILAREILSGVSGIAFCEFSELDVVRHPIVQEVIRAYECYERKKRGESIRESLHVEQK